MEKLSRGLVNKMVLQSIISREDYDVYVYYLQIKIEKAIFLILLSLLAVLMQIPEKRHADSSRTACRSASNCTKCS